MQFTIQKAYLYEALQKLQSVVEKKTTMQILGNILCEVKNKELTLSATDLEVGIKSKLPTQEAKDGKITVSAKHFFDIVKELPEKDIKVLRKDNHWVEIVCGKSRFNIVGLSPDEFPALPSFEEKTYHESRVEALREMIDKTEFAVSHDQTRYHLNGVYLEPLERGVMRMVATDGHRLSFVDLEVFKDSPDLKRGIIIPIKGLSELRKLIDKGGDSIGLAFERGYLFAKMANDFLFVRLIDGEYPDYKLVIPKSAEKQVKIDQATFNSALKRVSLLAHEKGRGVKLQFDAGVLVISSSNPDMGEAREEMDIQYKGEALEIGFNSKYLLDCLSVLSGDEVELSLKDKLSPGILKSVDQNNHTYVIMPMRI